jgi:DNA primase
MTDSTNFNVLAQRWQQALPARIRRYLNQRGISDTLIDMHMLGWNGKRITIPIFNHEGEVAYFKMAKDPEDQTDGAKMLSTPGVRCELYGWDQVFLKPPLIVICEGEFDLMVLQANDFHAATSTAGAGTFRPEWAEEFKSIKEVYVCYDRDEAGRRGALNVGKLVPHAKLVELPEEVGIGGDVTDFFVRLGHNRGDFLILLDNAKPVPAPQIELSIAAASKICSLKSPLAHRTERIKANTPIEEIIGQYVKLQKSGNNYTGLCPFHDDHKPSFAVYPSSGNFHCFSCSKHGDVIDFLMAIEHLSFSETMEALDYYKYHHG